MQKHRRLDVYSLGCFFSISFYCLNYHELVCYLKYYNIICYIDNAETEAWFIDSFEEWRKAKNLSNFILLGHSLGGYVAAKYALKVIVF